MASASIFDSRLTAAVAVAVVVAVSMVTELTHGHCCPPDHFSGPVRVLRTTVAPGMPDTDVTILMTAYDAKNKRVAIGYEQNITEMDHAPSSVYVRNILDYGKGFEYRVTGSIYSTGPQSKCTMYPLRTPWRQGACVPGNATASNSFYMGHPPNQPYVRTMDALAFTLTQRSLTAKVMVTAADCVIVGEVVYDTSDPAGTRVINRLYVNQTTYENDEFFTLPNVTCILDPNPPKTTPWQRMILFGWLLGLPEN